MVVKLTDDDIRSLCTNVTDEQRIFCLDRGFRPDSPEIYLRRSTKDPSGFDPTPFSVEVWWSVIFEIVESSTKPAGMVQ
jgi:hypothetical protein